MKPPKSLEEVNKELRPAFSESGSVSEHFLDIFRNLKFSNKNLDKVETIIGENFAVVDYEGLSEEAGVVRPLMQATRDALVFSAILNTGDTPVCRRFKRLKRLLTKF